MTFEENIYDGHTLDVVLKQTQTLTGNYPKTVKGYKGIQKIESISIIWLSKPLKQWVLSSNPN